MREELELRDYLAVLRARRWTVVVVLALVCGSALLLSSVQTPMYTASTRLLVRAIPSETAGWAEFPNLQTETELLSSGQVVGRVHRRLEGAGSPKQLLDDMRARHLDGTEVIVVEYTSSDPELARDAADAFGEEYIALRRERALDIVASAEEMVRERLEETRDQLAAAVEAAERARAAGDTEALTRAETDRSALSSRVGALQSRLDEIRPEPHALVGGEIVQAARVPESPSSPDHTRNGALGGVLGLMLGIGVAFLQEHLSDNLRNRGEIESAVEAPALGTIPIFAAPDDEPVLLTAPKDVASEAYRNLRTNVGFVLEQRDARALLLASPGEGEGKTSTTGNLGVAFAQIGRRVVLVSADMRRPALERWFGLGNGWGLSSWLAEGPDGMWPGALGTSVPGLSVLPSGPAPDRPAELLSSPRLPSLVRELCRRYDLVLVDSPPALHLADAAILAGCVHAAILVIHGVNTHAPAAVEAKLKLERVGSAVVGCVLNAVDPRGSGAYSPYQYLRHTRPVDAAGAPAAPVEPRLYRASEPLVPAPEPSTKRPSVRGLRRLLRSWR